MWYFYCQLVSPNSGKDTSVAELDSIDTSTAVAKLLDCTDTSVSVVELPSSHFILGRIGRASDTCPCESVYFF